MLDYTLTDGAYEIRPIKREYPPQRGWDVYALQSLLSASGAYDGALDGVAGDETAVAIWRYQRRRGITQDGKAGPQTKRYLLLDRIHEQTALLELPLGLARGHIQQESSFDPGNHTIAYPDGTRDLGVAMRNILPTYEAKLAWFNAPYAVAFMTGNPERGLRPRKNRYVSQPGILGDHRKAWECAVASWHAPSIADAVAAGKRDYPEYVRTYINRVIGYVKQWTA